MSEPLQQFLEKVWAAREDEIYPQLFGPITQVPHTLTEDLFRRIGVEQIEPFWLTHSVLESPPTASRPHWVYVTSSLSNPWGEGPAANEETLSGLGFEFVMHTPQQSPWAIRTLQWLMAMQILVASGIVEGQLLEADDRIPLGMPIDSRQSSLNSLVVASHDPAGFRLASGHVDLLLLLGVTQREYELAGTQGTPALLRLLTHHEIAPLTDPARLSTV